MLAFSSKCEETMHQVDRDAIIHLDSSRVFFIQPQLLLKTRGKNIVQFFSLDMPSLTDKELEDVKLVIEEKSRKNVYSEI